MEQKREESRWKKGGRILLAAAMIFLAGRGAAALFTQWTTTANIASAVDNWGLGFGAEGEKPTGNVSAEELKQYDTYYVGDGDDKVIYLTFDCGYENGNTPKILEALKKHQVKAKLRLKRLQLKRKTQSLRT